MHNYRVESDRSEVPVYLIGCVPLPKVSHHQQKVINLMIPLLQINSLRSYKYIIPIYLIIPVVEDHLYKSRKEVLVMNPGGLHQDIT